jgi:hypothetical protein
VVKQKINPKVIEMGRAQTHLILFVMISLKRISRILNSYNNIFVLYHFFVISRFIAIFQRVDHKSKLNLMLTCKRFEFVIGDYLQLFGKFSLKICKHPYPEKPDGVQTLTQIQIRRHFGTVELSGYDLRLDTEDYNLFFQMLTKIGPKLVELSIAYGKMSFASLVNLLKLTPPM